MQLDLLAQSAGLTDACGADPGLLCELVYDATGNATLAGATDWLVRPFKVVVILLIAYVAVRLVRSAVDRMVGRLLADQEAKAAAGLEAPAAAGDETGWGPLAALQRHAARQAERLALQAERGRQRAQTLGSVLKSLATFGIFTLAALMALGEFDINLGPLIASAGIVGIALGFGAQSLVKDFLSGIFMLVEDQFGVGDIVDVGEASGVVEAVNLRTTKLRDVNGTLWHVPNGEIRRVGNKSQEWARTVLDVEVAYDTDIEHAARVIKEVADGLWHEALENATILEEPEIWGVEQFGASAIAIRLAVKVEPAEQFATAREIRKRLKNRFDQEGIEIPFPQRTVWLHQVDPAPASGRVGAPTEESVMRPGGAPEEAE